MTASLQKRTMQTRRQHVAGRIAARDIFSNQVCFRDASEVKAVHTLCSNQPEGRYMLVPVR